MGKTSVAAELHAQLAAERIRHCLIEGDNLDLAWPTPWEHGLELAKLNLAAMWSAYQGAGYSRLIYTNTAAVRSDVLASPLAALGGDPVVHAVLLSAADDTVATRLAQREIGSALDSYLDRSQRAAQVLEETTPNWVLRINTDGHTVTETAQSLKTHLGWAPSAVDLR